MLKTVKYKIAEAPQSYWDFVNKHGTIYQSKPYLEYLAVSGREQVVVAVFEEDKLIGGAGIGIGRKILNYPVNMASYFGPVVNDAQKAAAVLKCIADAVKTMSLTLSVTVLPEHAEILAESGVISGWLKKEIEFIHWDISPEMDDLWRELPKGKKSSVNRARRENIIIQEINTKDDIKQFYKLHIMSMTRGEELTRPSLRYFEQLFVKLKPLNMAEGFLALLPETREPIASVVLLLGMKNIATYLAVGHNYNYRTLGATDLLVWHCLEFLKTRGFTVFDLVGLPKGSPRAEGICHFKTAWAGVNGRRCPSYILTQGNFGLTPKLIGRSVVFLKKVIKFISWGFGGK